MSANSEGLAAWGPAVSAASAEDGQMGLLGFTARDPFMRGCRGHQGHIGRTAFQEVWVAF